MLPMDHMAEARTIFMQLIDQQKVGLHLPVCVRLLTPDEAIGKHADHSFAIKKGK